MVRQLVGNPRVSLRRTLAAGETRELTEPSTRENEGTGGGGAAGLAGWAGSRIGRREGVRDAVLTPGEKVVATYNVQPPFTEHTPPAAHEGPQYQLRVIADGTRLRVHHQGQEVGTMLLERSGAAQEIRLNARRHGAA
ncbi:hypothetical protein [Streptomyces kanamyceticus]|uniref:hypothetical protein n=1 Tax=Streptomyces kanamyceticus TaxID=1967 RepID=UPI0037DCF2D0